jgi:hypothetical protein
VTPTKRIFRAFAYVWAFPATVAGALLALAARASGGRMRVVDGVLEAHGGMVTPLLRHAIPIRGGASAMTLGHVVVGRDPGCLERTRAHEREHVRQFERWGPAFIPAYLIASLVAAARGGHYYRDNAFEHRAVSVAARSAGRSSSPSPPGIGL